MLKSFRSRPLDPPSSVTVRGYFTRRSDAALRRGYKMPKAAKNGRKSSTAANRHHAQCGGLGSGNRNGSLNIQDGLLNRAR
jgi:hypothetical protein